MQVVKTGEWRQWPMLLLLLVWSGCVLAQPTLPLPERATGAATGSQFYKQIAELPDAARERMILEQISVGNVPDFLRKLVPIETSVTTAGKTLTARYYVSPEYVAVGSDSDFFRMPLSATLAQQVADVCSCTLPTRKIVNDVYQNAKGKLAPAPFSPAEYEITSPTVWWLSNRAIEDQRSTCGAALGELIAGMKKDIVITPLLTQRPPPPRVAIYGWHKLDGKAIQPLSLVHKSNYKDYSHGVRLVWQQLELDGQSTTVGAVLGDPQRSALLSDEGPCSVTRYPGASPAP